MPGTETHAFQTETQALLDLMIHSLYTNKDIFLRELISNASDALDRLRFESVTQPELAPEGEFEIWIETDPDARSFEIRDSGIGMSRDEVVENIGTIARSGTREFLARARELKGAEVPPELIGQFGVGFYASFMVADQIDVLTRRAGEESATRWVSSGEGQYTLEEAERETCGTTIRLQLREPDEEEGLQDYTQEWVLREIVRRYSDFVAYPIKMRVSRTEPPEEEGGSETVTVEEATLNSMKAIWTRSPDKVSDEEYTEFYKHISHDWTEPFERLSLHIEGNFEARALLFLPSKAPLDLYHPEAAHRGIQLYVKRIFIMDECKALLPQHLRFVRGVVDAEDLSLNISRELLQQDRQLQTIRRRLVKRLHEMLARLLAEDRQRYLSFWGELGAVVKEGLLPFSEDRERTLELVLAASTRHESELTTLEEYVSRMKEGQDQIYCITGSSRETVERSPHLEAFRERGYEVLLLTDRVDEVWVEQGARFGEHPFSSIGKGEVELGSEEEKARAREEREKQQEAHGDLLKRVAALLEDDIKEVRFSNRLTESPACLVSEEGGLTPQLEQLLRQSGQEVPRQKRILELNPDHRLLAKLNGLFEKDPVSPELESFVRLLHGQAALAEGVQLDDPAEFGRRVVELMLKLP